METVRNRLKDFLYTARISQAEFAKAIGVSTGYVNAIQKGVGTDILQRIQREYPDLNISWLMTGAGAMLYSQEAEGPASPHPENSPFKNSNMIKDDFLQLLKQKDDQVSDLIYQNHVLANVIARLTGVEPGDVRISPPPKKIGPEAPKTGNPGAYLSGRPKECTADKATRERIAEAEDRFATALDELMSIVISTLEE